jgi:hypothetical protein
VRNQSKHTAAEVGIMKDLLLRMVAAAAHDEK